MCGKALVTKQQAGNMSERKSIFTVLTVSHLYTIIDTSYKRKGSDSSTKQSLHLFFFIFPFCPTTDIAWVLIGLISHDN